MNAPSRSEHRFFSRRVRAALLGTAVVPVIFVLMIIWHECGHTVAAWLVGDWSARFKLVDLTYPCVGCNLYDSASMTPIPDAVVNAAGVFASQALAWGAVLLLVRRRRGLVVTWLLADVLGVTLADLVWQCVQALIFGAYDPMPLGRAETYVDGSAVVYLLHQATSLPQALITAALLALVTADLALTGVVLVAGVRRRRVRATRSSKATAPAVSGETSGDRASDVTQAFDAFTAGPAVASRPQALAGLDEPSSSSQRHRAGDRG